MNTLTRRIGVALTAALLATTAIAPLASARPFQGEQRQQAWHGESQQRAEWHGDSPHRADWHGVPQQRADWHGEQHRDNGGDNGAGLALGLGIAALAGVAIWSASQAPAPAYQPAYPAYPQPSYGQPYYAPTYVQPAYAQPSCTTINGAPACMGADGNWYYVR
jgi:hypothetical protein